MSSLFKLVRENVPARVRRPRVSGVNVRFVSRKRKGQSDGEPVSKYLITIGPDYLSQCEFTPGDFLEVDLGKFDDDGVAVGFKLKKAAEGFPLRINKKRHEAGKPVVGRLVIDWYEGLPLPRNEATDGKLGWNLKITSVKDGNLSVSCSDAVVEE